MAETTIQKVEAQDSFEFGKASSRMKIYSDSPETLNQKIKRYIELGYIDENGDPVVPKKQNESN